jgi:hypothetical protein
MTIRPNCRPTNRLPLHSRSAQLGFIYHQARDLTSIEFFTAATLGLNTTPCKLRAFSRTETAYAFCSFFPRFDGITDATQLTVNAGPSRLKRGCSFASKLVFIRIVRQTPDLKLRVYDTFRNIATIRGLSKRVQPRWDQQQKNSAHTVRRSLLALSLSSRARRKSILTKSALRMQAFTILKPG